MGNTVVKIDHPAEKFTHNWNSASRPLLIFLTTAIVLVALIGEYSSLNFRKTQF